TSWTPAGCLCSAQAFPSTEQNGQEVVMHWSRELLALTAGVRWRIAGLVVIGLLIVAASLASFVCAGRAIAAVFAGRAWSDFWFLIAGAAVAGAARCWLLYLSES